MKRLSLNFIKEVPPRVEYKLTDKDLSLLPILSQLSDWVEENEVG